MANNKETLAILVIDLFVEQLKSVKGSLIKTHREQVISHVTVCEHEKIECRLVSAEILFGDTE